MSRRHALVALTTAVFSSMGCTHARPAVPDLPAQMGTERWCKLVQAIAVTVRPAQERNCAVGPDEPRSIDRAIAEYPVHYEGQELWWDAPNVCDGPVTVAGRDHFSEDQMGMEIMLYPRADGYVFRVALGCIGSKPCTAMCGYLDGLARPSGYGSDWTIEFDEEQ